jgi:tetratricopeptide (TPR) repeat protein
MSSVARILQLTLLVAATTVLPARAARPLAVAGPEPAVPRSGAPAADPEVAGAETIGRYLSGRLLEERGLDAEALEEYLQALQSDPDRPGIELRVSEVASRLGDSQRALDYAARALAHDPGDARAYWLQGSALVNLGRPEESLKALQAAVAADSGQADYWKTLARVADTLDRVDLMASGWRHAVELDDSDGEAWFQLAAVEARLGHFAAADSMLAEASALNPVRPGALFLAGWIQEGLGHTEEALALYRQHLEVHQDDQFTRRRLVNLLVAAGRQAEAYKEAGIVRRAQPGDAEALAVEVDLALQLGHAKRAGELLDELLAADPADPGRVAQATDILARRGRGSEGIGRAESWALGHPADPRGALLVAQARSAAGDTAGAIAAARRAVEMAPDSLPPRFALGGLLQSAGRFAAAESVWTALARGGPAAARAGFQLARCRELMGDLDGAVGAAREALARQPGSSTALNLLGYLLADHGRDLDEAEGLIGRALAQEPDNGAILDSRGWVYYRLGRLAEARRDLERAVELTHGDPVVRDHLGDVYKDLGLIDLAREQYTLSLRQDQRNARVRAKLAGLR